MKRRRKWRPSLSPSFCYGNLKAITTPFLSFYSAYIFMIFLLSLFICFLHIVFFPRKHKSCQSFFRPPSLAFASARRLNRSTHVKVGLFVPSIQTTHSSLMAFSLSLSLSSSFSLFLAWLHFTVSGFPDSSSFASNSRYMYNDSCYNLWHRASSTPLPFWPFTDFLLRGDLCSIGKWGHNLISNQRFFSFFFLSLSLLIVGWRWYDSDNETRVYE